MGKKYNIGGRDYELRPLTLRQRKLAQPIWSQILTSLKGITELGDNNPSALIDISVQLDSMLLADDNAFQKFLASILVPSESVKWREEMIEENYKLMNEIDEDTQSEVLQDFLMRRTNLKQDLSNSTQNSEKSNQASPEEK